MITVLFFAGYREKLDCDKLRLDAGDYPKMLSALREQLASKGEQWREVLTDSRTLVAVNQAMTHADYELCEGDEIAFFPPVTGG